MADYLELANKINFTYLDETNPFPPVRERVRWRCNHCGRVQRIAYNQLLYKNPACRCWGGVAALNKQSYRSLADKLGIVWLEEMTAPKAKDVTSWIGCNGEVFQASYADVRALRKRLRRYFARMPQMRRVFNPPS